MRKTSKLSPTLDASEFATVDISKYTALFIHNVQDAPTSTCTYRCYVHVHVIESKYIYMKTHNVVEVPAQW